MKKYKNKVYKCGYLDEYYFFIKNNPTSQKGGCLSIAIVIFVILYIIGSCSSDNRSGSGSKKSTVNEIYLSNDSVYYNTKFGRVLRHCNYENGEMLEMTPNVQCPAYLRR